MLVGLGLAAFGCDRKPEVPAEIRVGFLADMPTPVGQTTVDAARMAVSEINDAGGIDIAGVSHRVTLVVEDTGNTPEGATRASFELINREKVVAIVGSSFSRNAIPSGEVAERAGIPMICPGSTHPRTTAARRYVFRVSFLDSYQGRMMARFAREDLGLETVAVLSDVADTYSRDMAAVFGETFEAAGGRVVAAESFTSGDTDFTPQLERIRDAGPEALFLPNFTDEIILQGRQARRLGLDAVFLGSDSWLALWEAKPPELQGAFFALSWHRDVGRVNVETRSFVDRYLQFFGREPDEIAAVTYDAFGLLFAAIGGASGADPGSIREALSQIEDFPGVTGPITYRGRGGDPRRGGVIVRLEEGGLQLFKMLDPEPEG